MPEVIKSISYSQDEILQSIMTLYLGGEAFELDPTYSKGNFYKNIPKPKYKFDIAPQTDDTMPASSDNLPLKPGSVKSIICDPPFMFGCHGQTRNNIMNKRFTMYQNLDDLVEHYTRSIEEFNRILQKGGILAFKCQDYTDSQTTMTHCMVFNMAVCSGFKAVDIFILLAKQRIWNPKLKQRVARKFHSYVWVFRKAENIADLLSTSTSSFKKHSFKRDSMA